MSSKTTFMQIRVTPKQKTAIRALAKRAGTDMSTYILEKTLPAQHLRWSQLLAALAASSAPQFAVADIHDFLAGLSARDFSDAVAALPPRSLEPYWANYVAAMAECTAHQRGVAPPQWTKAIAPLTHPAFGTDLLSLRPLLLRTAPPPFRNRNIFIDATVGARV